jgi:predicted nucleotidyltransferase
MNDILEARRAEISSLCRQFHVSRLDRFGSAARGSDFSDQSDFDFLVAYEPPHSPPALDDFFALRDALAALLGRRVDLTMESAVRNPFLRAAIERSRQPLQDIEQGSFLLEARDVDRLVILGNVAMASEVNDDFVVDASGTESF